VVGGLVSILRANLSGGTSNWGTIPVLFTDVAEYNVGVPGILALPCKLQRDAEGRA